MSLEKWLEYGWLRRKPSSANEIKALLGIVRRNLDDSKVDAISTDLRFVATFTAALTAATIALRASGYRTVTQVGHHTKIIESLELTIDADTKLIQSPFNNSHNTILFGLADTRLRLFRNRDVLSLTIGSRTGGAVCDVQLSEYSLRARSHGQIKAFEENPSDSVSR